MSARINATKVCLPQMRQHICSGSFARSNLASNNKTHQIIGTRSPLDRNMPKEMREKLLRSKNSCEQVAVALEYQSARASSVQVCSLHQRKLVNVEGCMRI